MASEPHCGPQEDMSSLQRSVATKAAIDEVPTSAVAIAAADAVAAEALYKKHGFAVVFWESL